jgi:membrane protein
MSDTAGGSTSRGMPVEAARPAGRGPKRLLARAQASRPWRAWNRFSRGRGTVLAGGMTYASFFSLFPALAAGFSIFGLILGNNAELQARVVQAVNDSFGTPIVKVTEDDAGIVLLSALTDSSALSVTGLIAFVGLLFTGLGWLDATREGIRSMFGQPPTEGNIVGIKLRDVAVLLGLGVVILASAAGGIVVNAATDASLRWMGMDDSGVGEVVLGVLSTLLLLAVDFSVLVLLLGFLSGVRLPRNDLRDGALAGAIGLGLLKIFAGLLLGRLTENRFLAAFAVGLGLLVWLNLVARILLLAAAWGAQTALDRGHLLDATPGQPARLVARLATAATRSAAPPEPQPMFTPMVSPRAADRVSVVAGAILGAAAVTALRAASGAVRTVSLAVRRDDD